MYQIAIRMILGTCSVADTLFLISNVSQKKLKVLTNDINRMKFQQ